jgi:ATP-dependent protease ClpP protease subunit
MAQKTIHILDAIGDSMWSAGYTYKQWIKDYSDIKAKDDIEIVLNSPGGNVFDGLSIYNAIKGHQGKKTVRVMGIAASIASVIAMAADEVIMAEGTLMMIHNASSVAFGNADEIEKEVKILRKIDAQMASLYATATGLPEEEVIKMMEEETWMTPQEAMEKGFADRSEGEALLVAIHAKNPFQHAPQHIAALFTGNKPTSIQAAAIPNKESGTMPDTPANPVEHPVSTPAPVVATQAAKAPATYTDADLNEITQLCEMTGQTAKLAGFLKSYTPVAEVRAALHKLAQGEQPSVGGAPSIVAGADVKEKFHKAAVDAIVARYSKVKVDPKATAGNPAMGMGIQDIGAECLYNAGLNVRRGNKIEILRSAMSQGRGGGIHYHGAPQMSGYNHSTGSLPLILADALNKVLVESYQEAEHTWNRWCSVVSLSDFKERKVSRLSELNDPEQIRENGEIPEASYSEERETYGLISFGQKLTFTREMLINDDLNALMRRTRNVAQAYARNLQRRVSAILNLGTTAAFNMSDGTPLFEASLHKNYGTTGTALSGPNLQAAIIAFAKQTGLNGEMVNIAPRYLHVPPALQFTAAELLNSTASTVDNKSSGVVNTVRGIVELNVDPFLQATLNTGGSDTAWYLTADGVGADTVEVAFLNGVNAPTLEENTNEGSILGLSMISYMDSAVKAIDYRTMRKLTGQA